MRIMSWKIPTPSALQNKKVEIAPDTTLHKQIDNYKN
jgi:hypothetical protein